MENVVILFENIHEKLRIPMIYFWNEVSWKREEFYFSQLSRTFIMLFLPNEKVF